MAEKYFADDPNAALVRLRQFGELLGQQVADLFDALRKVGNVATHDSGPGTHSDALQALKMARSN